MDEKARRTSHNLALLNEIGGKFSLLKLSQNMLSHSITDTSSSLRELLSTSGVHDYSIQEFGPEHKKMIPTEYLAYKKLDAGASTLYRATKRGDCRIWFGAFTRKYAEPDDQMAIFAKNGKIFILNLSKYDIKRALYSDFLNPIKDFLSLWS